MEKIKNNSTEEKDSRLSKITNIFIKNVTENLKNFSYNKIIANLYETYNHLFSEIDNHQSKKTLIENYQKILIVMMPIIPHFANECFECISENKEICWPLVDESLLIEENTNYVIQINGKKRAIIKAKKNLTEKELFDQLSNIVELEKYIKDKLIKRKIFIPNKLINIIM